MLRMPRGQQSPGELGQVGVELGHHRGALTDGPSDALDRAAPDIAHGEDAGDVGLQRGRDGSPSAAGHVVPREVRAGSDEPLGVERDIAVAKPLGRRVSADEEKDVSHLLPVLGAGAGVSVLPPRNPEFAVLARLQAAQLGLRVDVDVGRRGDPVDEVTGGGLGEALAPDQHQDPRRVPGEKHRGLSRGVPASHQDHVLPAAVIRLDGRGPVGDAPTLEGLEPGEVGPTVPGPGGQDHGSCGDVAPVVQLEAERPGGPVAGTAVEADHLRGNRELRPELRGLREPEAGELLATEANRKAEVVLDASAHSSLTPEAPGIDDQDRQTLGGRVDRRGQARGARPHHRHVVPAQANRVRKNVEVAAQGDVARILQHRAVGTDRERKVLRPGRVTIDQRRCVRVGRGIEDGVRVAAPQQKLLKAVQPGMVPGGDEGGTGEPERGERLASEHQHLEEPGPDSTSVTIRVRRPSGGTRSASTSPWAMPSNGARCPHR